MDFLAFCSRKTAKTAGKKQERGIGSGLRYQVGYDFYLDFSKLSVLTLW
jgi:hypothetical protein